MKFTYEILLSKIKEHHIFDKVEITPDIAHKMLSHNNFNRPMKNASIRKYANHIRKGRWQYNGDSIRFDRNNNLLDGQNRLQAVILAGLPIVINVQTGLEVSSFQTIDSGTSRTAGDIVHIHGINNSGIVASSIRTIINYRSNLLLDKKGSTNNMDIEEFINDPKNDLDFISQLVKISYRYGKNMRFIPAASYTALMYLFNEKHGEKYLEFFELLDNGIGLDKENIIYILRQKLIKDATQYRGYDNIEKMAYVIKTFNYWIKGKKISLIVWNRNKEKFPQII